MGKKDPTWGDAIQKVLSEAGGALHYAEVAERITSQRLKTNTGATPAATVASVLSMSMREPDTPYVRVARGEYALKATLSDASKPPDKAAVESEIETGAVRAFGMFWRRDQVLWSGKPRILGRQGQGAIDVNFAEQIGVYLLHDRERVIYVGRAADTLFARLRAHTLDRLSGRWDRFSWFGLRGVGEDGALSEPIANWAHNVAMETMEALLIESLEPPLNRKRGDNFAAAEYLQTPDPEIEKRRKKELLDELRDKLAS